ncbi:MBL fold metallo-hydrolase [Anaeroselena agilis]|uniref:MBL fold metallo-hydrolase n=1 Tax=Anaeroselena agilis TaxID=3063788 RepID=A0ABU3NTT5_9FIRM|nr:MBL fold metallo-hydrolase [Selenomonadales bacterium 4137-cl]
MELRLVRHATHIVNMGGVKLLVDPVLSPAGAMPPIDNSPNPLRNPLVGLPINESDLAAVDGILCTHTHRDHFDAAAAERLPKELPVFCQPADEAKFRDFGFVKVTAVGDTAEWRGVSLTRTGGRHGSGELAERMGPVSGYVLRCPGEPTLYIAGDTVWCPEVAAALAEHRPEVIVLFAGAAQFLSGGPITMGTADIAAVCAAAPAARVMVVHMEAFNHCLLTRPLLREFLEREGLAAQVTVPADGASVKL